MACQCLMPSCHACNARLHLRGRCAMRADAAPPAACMCLRHSCAVCFPVNGGPYIGAAPGLLAGAAFASGCCCLLPSCPTCGPRMGGHLGVPAGRVAPLEGPFSRASTRLTGSGHTASPEMNALISIVHFEIRRMLDDGPGPKYLSKGPDWDHLANSMGTKLDNMVALLCHCGIRAVKAAVARAAEARNRTAYHGRRHAKPGGSRHTCTAQT